MKLSSFCLSQAMQFACRGTSTEISACSGTALGSLFQNKAPVLLTHYQGIIPREPVYAGVANPQQIVLAHLLVKATSIALRPIFAFL